MTCSNRTDLCILRPYALSSLNSISSDRYFHIASSLTRLGYTAIIYAQRFSHSTFRPRLESELTDFQSAIPFARFANTPSYTHTIALSRLISEFVYSIQAFFFLFLVKPSRVLVGEPLFFTGWLAIIYGLITGSEIIADFIDAWPESLSIPKRSALVLHKPVKVILFPLLISRHLRCLLYDRIFVCSNSYLSLLPLSRRPDVLTYYWCSSLSEPIKLSGSIDIQPFRIAYTGSLGHGYDIETIIQAADILESLYPGIYRIDIAGSGPKAHLLENTRIKSLFYHGFLSTAHISTLLSRSHCMLLPYRLHSAVSMPIKFFDSIAIGLPVLSSLTLEAADLIKSHSLGLTFTAGHPDSLVRAIMQIHDNYSLYYRKSQLFSSSQASKRFDKDFSYNSFAQSIVSSSQVL